MLWVFIYLFIFLITLVSGQSHSQLSPKGVQRPNGKDVKSVVAKARIRVAGSTAVPPLPPSYERLVFILLSAVQLLYYYITNTIRFGYVRKYLFPYMV